MRSPGHLHDIVMRVLAIACACTASVAAEGEMMAARLNALVANNVTFDTVVDVGAHHGEWYNLMHGVSPQANILSLEADGDNAPKLEAAGVARYRIAVLGDRDGAPAKFFKTKHWANTGNSLFREETKFFQEGAADAVQVKLETLDTLLSEEEGFAEGTIDLLKLDVQGAELMVLKGAQHTLKRTQFLLLEASIVRYNKGAPLAADIIAALDAYGFQVADFVEMHYYDDIAFQVDILFVRRSSNRAAVIDATGAHIPAASSLPLSSSDIVKQAGAGESPVALLQSPAASIIAHTVAITTAAAAASAAAAAGAAAGAAATAAAAAAAATAAAAAAAAAAATADAAI
ncbi:S-adenosyl-L-methionine-dependent methyltransferase [Tribonema minus]|uniref:S-adenosyl-L-methionine-dependent methyltransferase n=1 Tax=Tribonema minus TaxID=303371 RepID=A0A836CD51_9STRA|nr:S-adenosyl-L-methionine-dependent methyltransferase [Tribonema minus]